VISSLSPIERRDAALLNILISIRRNILPRVPVQRAHCSSDLVLFPTCVLDKRRWLSQTNIHCVLATT
jgi:hypothetical protein